MNVESRESRQLSVVSDPLLTHTAHASRLRDDAAGRLAASRNVALSRGLTLIELLAVVTLIGVAIGVVTLRLDGFTETGRLRAATAQLEALINVLRTEAMTSGHAVVLRYTRDQGTIAVLRPTVRGDEIAWIRTPGVELPGAVRVTHVTIGDDEATDPAQWNHLDVRIDPDGILDSHRVTLTLPGGRHVVVAIDPVTGEATAHEPNDNHPEPTP